MPKLMQSFNFESISLFSLQQKNEVNKSGLLWQLLGNSNVKIQCTFTIIQYCIIYIIWRLAMLFIPRPEHSRPKPRPRPKTQGQGQGQRIPRPKPRNLALRSRPRPRPRINIPADHEPFSWQNVPSIDIFESVMAYLSEKRGRMIKIFCRQKATNLPIIGHRSTSVNRFK